MEIDCLNVFTATARLSYGETPLYASLQKFVSEYNFDGMEDNDVALPFVYNTILDEAKENGLNHIVIVHDDVHLEHDPTEKLKELLDKYDLVGVAGTTRLEMKSPALWHLMGGGFEGRYLRGAVAHGTKDSKVMTSFGPYPARVAAIDGVFMAFNRKAIETLRFDERCPSSFHFYDLCLCARAVEQGLRIGVGDITITHESPGLREFTEDWKVGEKYYLETYGKY